MEGHQKDHKTLLLNKIKEISAAKSVSINREKHWERFEYGVKTSVRENDDVLKLESLTQEHVDEVLNDWIKRTMNKRKRPDIGPFDIDKIEWHRSRSTRTGEYFERLVDRNNPNFKRCVNLLTLNEKRSCVIDGFFVWVFKDERTLGRKPARERTQ